MTAVLQKLDSTTTLWLRSSSTGGGRIPKAHPFETVEERLQSSIEKQRRERARYRCHSHQRVSHGIIASKCVLGQRSYSGRANAEADEIDGEQIYG